MHPSYVPKLSSTESVFKGISPELKNDKNKFKVMLNVNQYKPGEVEVKLVDNYVVIHGKHEEKLDEHGFIKREFTRRYLLPEGTEADSLTSSWSLNGILTIEAPRKVREPVSDERVIPIAIASDASGAATD